MRASTVFALVITILIALGVVIGIRASGILQPPVEEEEPAPPLILVAATNLFEGQSLEPTDVRLRPARTQEEVEALQAGELLPPVTQAVARRIAKINIPADTPLRREHLEDMAPPTDIAKRIPFGHRAVNIQVYKPTAAGCLAEPGDLVDVELVTTAEGTDANGQPIAARGCTAIIARNALVIAKRNNIWPVNTPIGPQCPCNYTLAVNPYRAGLIEFAKDKGILTMHILGEAERREFEQRFSSQDGTVAVSWSIPGSEEYANEDERVAAYLSGNYTIGEHDLARLCRLTYTPPKVVEPIQVEKISGVRYLGNHVFERPGRGGYFASVSDMRQASADRGASGAGPRRSTGGGTGAAGQVGSTPFRFRPPTTDCPPGQSTAQRTVVTRRD